MLLVKANRMILKYKFTIIRALKMICIDNKVWIYYPLIVKSTANYKEQVVITSIILGICCLIYKILVNKRENISKN